MQSRLRALRGASLGGAASPAMAAASPGLGSTDRPPSRPDPRALLLRTTELPPEEEEEEDNTLPAKAAPVMNGGGASASLFGAPGGSRLADTPSNNGSPARAPSSGGIVGGAGVGLDGGTDGDAGADGDLDKYLPVLTSPESFTEPPMAELVRRLRERGPAALQKVVGFGFGRRGYGVVRFDGAVDVTGLPLEEIVQFRRHGEVVGYPDGMPRPEFGKGLHRPATVELLGVWKKDKVTGAPVTDPAAVAKYESKLRGALKDDGEFISYDPLEGRWTFRVKEF